MRKTFEKSSDFFFNREISWLKFNERVLLQSLDLSHPLLERIRFLSITSSNLDEFFMIRVGGLVEKYAQKKMSRDLTGKTIDEQLQDINQATHQLVSSQYKIWDFMTSQMKREQIEIFLPAHLNSSQNNWLKEFFEENILPFLTPTRVEGTHSFANLPPKNPAILFQLSRKSSTLNPEKDIFLLPLPSHLPRAISLPGVPSKSHFVLLEEVIRHFQKEVFPDFHGHHSLIFRMTRNTDFPLETEEIADCVQNPQKFGEARKNGLFVRLEVEDQGHPKLLRLLKPLLRLDPSQIYSISGPLDLTFLNKMLDQIKKPQFFYRPFTPDDPTKRTKEKLFTQIKKQDLLLHHPYDSYEPVVSLLEQSASDPRVVAIKQTIYRAGHDPRIPTALIKAAENGKEVTVLMEVKARFDEENNLLLAKKLEQAGCRVIYSPAGIKTHGKMLLIWRKERHRIQSYVHLGTGNYNPTTAKLYTDLSFFTCQPEIAEDAATFFTFLETGKKTNKWNKLSIAPFQMRKKLLWLIQREIEHAQQGKSAEIIAKMNSLMDQKVIQKLYEASAAGVKISLIIRGICVLKPGVPGLSENIRVESLIGRFLEHTRIFFFQNAGDSEYYISSADWMHRNLSRRIEILAPIESPKLQNEIAEILSCTLKDTRKFALEADGSYQREVASPSVSPFNSQDFFLKLS